MSTTTNNEPKPDSFIATVCQIMGWISMVGGFGMVALAITARSSAMLSQAFAAVFIGIFASVIWFALGRIIFLLTSIDHNSRK
jgi:uncharacterized membrane protein